MYIASTVADDALCRLAEAALGEGFCFVSPTPATQGRVNARSENALAHDLRGVLGWSRPFAETVVPPDIFALMRTAGILARDGEHWRSRVRLSLVSGLAFFHSAYPTTASDAVFFGPDTYRFARAIAHWIERCPVLPRRVVDVGCGAGPGAIIAARALPEAEVLGVDINPAALALTRVNARLAGVTVAVCLGDLLNDLSGVFDLIVANPPYLVDPAARAYRHGGGELGADLSRRIVAAACARLAPGGTLLLYTGAAIIDGRDPFREGATALLDAAGLDWTYEEVDPDVFGEELAEASYVNAERIAAVVLIATKNSRPTG